MSLTEGHLKHVAYITFVISAEDDSRCKATFRATILPCLHRASWYEWTSSSGDGGGVRICAFGLMTTFRINWNFSRVPRRWAGRRKKRDGRSRTERGRMRERMREKVRGMRDRDREEGEADQRRVESREAGSVPFSRSQAAIPFRSDVTFARHLRDRSNGSFRKKMQIKLKPLQMSKHKKIFGTQKKNNTVERIYILIN